MSCNKKMTIKNSYLKAFTEFSYYSAIAGLCLSLSGCGMFFGDEGIFRNRENDYQKAATIAPLELPAGMRSESMGELYPIPNLGKSNVAIDGKPSFSTPRPLPISANLQQENVKIQRVGGESWILLNVSPGEVWPRVRNFLNVNDLTVARADVSKGILETNWMQFKTDLTTYDRYRIQIDQGVQPETSEVHIIHMSVPVSQNRNNVAWATRSVNPEREKWLMDELSATLAADVGSSGTSLLAQAIGGDVKASLSALNGEPIMLINLDRTRTLATLGFAANHDGFTTFDSSPADGLFFIDYLSTDDAAPGFFSRLFGKKEPKKLTSIYKIADIKPYFLQGEAFDQAPRSNLKQEKALKKISGYMLVVKGEGNSHTVFVRDPVGKRISTNDARELLILLRKNLI